MNTQKNYDLTVSFRAGLTESLSVEIIARDAVGYRVNISLTRHIIR